MILTLFSLMLVLALVSLGLGYFTGDELYALAGLVILFLMSMVILTGNLEYETGSQVNSTYTYENGIATAASHTISYEYTAWDEGTYSDQWWTGWLFAIATGFGLGFMMFNMKSRTKKDGE